MKGPCIPADPTPPTELLDQLNDFAVRYHVEHLACATTLRYLPRSHGEITEQSAARKAIEHRNRQVANAFTTSLLPHTADLIRLARSSLDSMPPARHHAGWRLLLDDLDHATERIHHLLSASRVDAQLWPYLTTWAEHSLIVRDLVGQHRAAAVPLLPAVDKERLTALALDARDRGTLEPLDSWYDAAGRRITLAYLIEHDDSTVLVLAEDTGGDITALGRYGTEYEACRASPLPVPAGVLRPDAPWRTEQPSLTATSAPSSRTSSPPRTPGTSPAPSPKPWKKASTSADRSRNSPTSSACARSSPTPSTPLRATRPPCASPSSPPTPTPSPGNWPRPERNSAPRSRSCRRTEFRTRGIPPRRPGRPCK
jgi:hypothetical protein